MYKKFAFALVCVFAFAGSALAGPPFYTPWMITYDGYLQQTYTPGVGISLQADTLIVVTNSHPTKTMGVWIEVYEKGGELVYEGTLYDGGELLFNSALPPNEWCWITLGMVIGRTTGDPWGTDGGEKFSFRIRTAPYVTAPVVEVKQVVYSEPMHFPAGQLIWQSQYFKTWSEAALGGLNGTGVVKAP